RLAVVGGMRRDEAHTMAVLAVGQGHAQRGGSGEGGADATDDAYRDSGLAQEGDLLARTAEHQRLAALHPDHAQALQRVAPHQPADEGLWRGAAAATLAHP